MFACYHAEMVGGFSIQRSEFESEQPSIGIASVQMSLARERLEFLQDELRNSSEVRPHLLKYCLRY